MSLADQIKAATVAARAKMGTLDAATSERLKALYAAAVADLRADLTRYADAEGNLRLEVLTEYLRQARAQLAALGDDQRVLIGDGLLRGAELGAEAWKRAGLGVSVTQIADTAVRFVENYIAADGLNLSQRLWRIENGAVKAVSDTLRINLVLGRDASQTTREFLARGEPTPLEVQANVGADRALRLGTKIEDVLTKTPGNAYSNALRVFRTELNRAHGEAYQLSASASSDVIGMKFVLSPNHPRRDICDYYAQANLYGLGPGVYPVGQAPWPAHPNTMSYLVAVFKDEVSAADRANQTSPTDWLQQQSPAMQDQILGVNKARALRAGVLEDTHIETPWNQLKPAYEQRGYSF